MICTHCATPNALEARYCSRCGERLALSDATPHFEDTVPQGLLPHASGSDAIAATPTAPSPAQLKHSSNFLLTHWRGEYPLAFSYWVCGTLLTIVALAFVKAVHTSQVLNDLGQRGTGASVLLIYVSLTLIAVWQAVGVWRSAGLHVQRGGRSGWAVAARVMVVLTVLRTGVEFAQTGYPVMAEGLQLLLGTDHTPAYAIRLLRDGTEIELSGGMPYGTASALRQALDAAPDVKVIHLNSQGGRMQEAYKLHKTIQDRKLVTYTSAQCASACAFAFLAGSQRFIGESARLGFHSVSIGSLSGRDLKEVNDEYRRAMQSRGIPDSFIDRALSTSPQSIWYPTNAELLANKVIDAVVDSRTYAISGLAQWHDAKAVEAGLLTVPAFAALAKFDAKNYARLRDLMVSGIQKGNSQNEIQLRIRTVFMGEVIPSYLQTAQDAPLVNYWRNQIAEMSALATTSQQMCADFAFPQFAHTSLDFKSAVPKALQAQDLQALAALIESGATQPHAVDNQKPQAQADLQAAVVRMSASVPNGMDVMRAPAKYKDDAGALCAATLGLYREILAIPGEDRVAAVFRHLH
jgi:hypothetical protein